MELNISQQAFDNLEATFHYWTPRGCQGWGSVLESPMNSHKPSLPEQECSQSPDCSQLPPDFAQKSKDWDHVADFRETLAWFSGLPDSPPVNLLTVGHVP